jgi:hypothetical protein
MIRLDLRKLKLWQLGIVLALSFVIFPFFYQLVTAMPRALVEGWWNTSYGPDGAVTRRVHRIPKTLDDLL